jgi:hypothetical protein
LHDLNTERGLIEEINLTNGAELTVMLNQLIDILSSRAIINMLSDAKEDKIAAISWHESLLTFDERFNLNDFVERAVGEMDQPTPQPNENLINRILDLIDVLR